MLADTTIACMMLMCQSSSFSNAVNIWNNLVVSKAGAVEDTNEIDNEVGEVRVKGTDIGAEEPVAAQPGGQGGQLPPQLSEIVT